VSITDVEHRALDRAVERAEARAGAAALRDAAGLVGTSPQAPGQGYALLLDGIAVGRWPDRDSAAAEGRKIQKWLRRLADELEARG
jgi:hypothetical protein